MNVFEFNQKKYYSEGSGVSALVDHRIAMILNEFGIYEEIVRAHEDDELHPNVEKVSPYLNADLNETIMSEMLYKDVKGIKFDDRLGYYLTLYAGYVKEGDYRLQASSGGYATWIFKELFERDLIDGVIHVKRNQDTESEIMFKYGISRSVKEIQEGAKTKYYPLECSEVLTLVKEQPGRYAIIGIPSFIMALRSLALVEPVFKERIHFMIGLVCGHQKSSKFLEAMAWQMGFQPHNLINIDFRKKIPHQPAIEYGVEMTGMINNKQVTFIKPMSEIVVADWGEGYFKQVASDYTDDVMNETADITLGDAWLPHYEHEWEGNSLATIRHPLLAEIFEEGIQQDKLKADFLTPHDVVASQVAHFRHTREELSYRLALKDQANQWRPILRVKPSFDIPPLRQEIQRFRMHFANQSHIQYQEAKIKNDFKHFEDAMKHLSHEYKKIYQKGKKQHNDD